MKTNQKLLMRYYRSLGLQQGEIAELLGLTNHQTIGYNMRTMRKAFLDKHEASASQRAGGVSPLVGFMSSPPPPSQEDMDHTCPHFVQSAAYAQLEDLPKHQKIAVLLSLLEEVESE